MRILEGRFDGIVSSSSSLVVVVVVSFQVRRPRSSRIKVGSYSDLQSFGEVVSGGGRAVVLSHRGFNRVHPERGGKEGREEETKIFGSA